MTGPNHTITFRFDRFDEFDFDELPKGEMMRVALNPYTGKLVLTYQDYEVKNEVVACVLNQIGKMLHKMRMEKGGFVSMNEFAAKCETVYEPENVKRARYLKLVDMRNSGNYKIKAM